MKLDYEKDILSKTSTEVTNDLKGFIYLLNPVASKYLVVHSSMISLRN